MSSAFLAQLVTFAHTYPHPDTEPSESWDQKCALLMARLGLALHGIGWAVQPRGYGDAYPIAVATGNVTPLNKNAAAAPIGAFHFWIISGTVGHVGVDANGGGTTVFMATTHLSQSVEADIGINSVAGYTAFAVSQGGHYVGWADNYNGGKYKLPSELTANQRITKVASSVRATPSNAANVKILATLPAGTTETILGYRTDGGVVDGVGTWLQIATGWVWLGDWTTNSLTGLKNVTPAVVTPPVVTTPVVTQPVEPPVVTAPVVVTPSDPEPPVTTAPVVTQPTTPVTTTPSTTTTTPVKAKPKAIGFWAWLLEFFSHI